MSDERHMSADVRITIRLTQQELEKLNGLMQEMQERIGHNSLAKYVRVTQRMVIVEALDGLAYKWHENDRKSGKLKVDGEGVQASGSRRPRGSRRSS